MSGITITFAIIALMVFLFVTNWLPVAVTALGASLLLYATGVLPADQALAGFGDPTVLFIGSLFVVSASLDASGVTAWAGQLLTRHAGQSAHRMLLLTLVLSAGLAALIGVSGAVSALLPVVVLAAVRSGRSPSRLMMPLAFAAHAGSMLVLTGSLVNVLISNAKQDIGLAGLRFFDLTVIGIPLLAGTVVIMLLLSERLVPERSGRAIPEDFSRHSRTLADQYRLFDGLFHLEITAKSALVGSSILAIELGNEPELSLIGVQPMQANAAPGRDVLAIGDILLLRGEEKAVDRFAEEKLLMRRREEASEISSTDVRDALFNTRYGFAEVVIPPRSSLIGQAMFPGMLTPSGDLMVLAVQRRGKNLPPRETTLAAGDTVLLQGKWAALDEHLRDPDVLVVDQPDLVRRQAVEFGANGKIVLAVLAILVLILATGAVPRAIAGLTVACVLVGAGVLKIEEAYGAINWTALILIASLIPLSTAMYQTGAAQMMAAGLVDLVGNASPYALLAALFILTAMLCQLISSTASALILIPVAISAAGEVGVSPRTALVTVAVAAAASFLTPVASSVNLMVQGPGGYRFTDYWRLGLPLTIWFFLVGVFLVPVFWPF